MTAKYTSWAFAAGYAIVIVGAIVHILGYSAGFYVFCIGILINTVSRFKLLPASWLLHILCTDNVRRGLYRCLSRESLTFILHSDTRNRNGQPADKGDKIEVISLWL